MLTVLLLAKPPPSRFWALKYVVPRIMELLVTPDYPIERLLGVVTIQCADGRRISLAEYPLAQVLSTGEIVRTEEVVLQAPNGLSVSILINSTPILSEDGGAIRWL